jgi:DNA-binding HxlR family transcriptional regulator
MRRASFSDMRCSVAQTLEVVGEWWTMLIVRDAFLGVSRFEDFQRRLGIARNVLASRLHTLVDHGVLERRQYQDRPARYEYRLTPKGKDLWPVLTAMREWGDRWTAGREGPPMIMVHDSCGQATTSVMTCAHCGEPLRPRDVHVETGPAAEEPAAAG